MGPKIRPRIMMPCQALCIFLLLVVLSGIIPHYWFPLQYRQYLWLLAGLNIVVAVLLYFRMPESPRWLEARERRDQARKVVERMETRVSWGGRIALAEPDLAPHQVVAEEKTSWLAVFGKNYLFVTILLLVVMALGYGGIVYGAGSQSFLFLSFSRGYSAGFVFALTAWSGVVSAAVYLINAFFGERFERRWVQLFGAILFAGGWLGMYEVHNTTAVVTLFSLRAPAASCGCGACTCTSPTTTRPGCASLGTGWTDGVGHLGAWGGVLIAGQLFVVTAPRNLILFITIPCALVPGVLLAIFGKNQRRRALEETDPIDAGPPAGLLAAGSFPRCLRRHKQGVTGGPALTGAGLPPMPNLTGGRPPGQRCAVASGESAAPRLRQSATMRTRPPGRKESR